MNINDRLESLKVSEVDRKTLIREIYEQDDDYMLNVYATKLET